jgi:DNA-directed RNA polymerase sigma subunit (sigma70/sigma32)
MATFLWPNEGGWPYPDEDNHAERVDALNEPDDDLLTVKGLPIELLEGLDPLERLVISARFGVAGHPLRSMRQLQQQTGAARGDLRQALGSGLDKLRGRLG